MARKLKFKPRAALQSCNGELYQGERFICPGYFPEVKRQAYAGRKFIDDFPPVQGHLVIRVDPGGKSWGFSILTTEDESMRVLFHKEVV